MIEERNKTDELNDTTLLTAATERMKNADPSTFVPADRLYKELGITQEDIDAIGDVDIE